MNWLLILVGIAIGLLLVVAAVFGLLVFSAKQVFGKLNGFAERAKNASFRSELMQVRADVVFYLPNCWHASQDKRAKEILAAIDARLS